jgi:hypothetical protein
VALVPARQEEALSDLYNRDIVAWSKLPCCAGAAVRGLANEAELDWENIAEEIESVGRGDLHAVTSWLTQEPRHDLKAEAWP